MDSCSLLHRYRDDRRKLLEFLIGLIADVRSTSGSDIDFDAISADYVIQCIHSAGGVLDVSKATTKHIDESMLPTMIHSQTGDSFFLLSEPDSAGSPPRRVPPSVETNHSQRDSLYSSIPPVSSNGLEATVSGQDFGVNHSYAVPSSSKSTKKTVVPSLGFPALRTGLSDDDLRESAYEVLLSCIAFSGIAIHSLENPKKDKGSRFLTGLKNRKDRRHLRSYSVGNQFEIIDTIRVQMQISEAMDECIRQRLMQFSMRKSNIQVDIPQISLELLGGIEQNEFLIERSYTQWRKRQANILEELFSSVNYPEMQELGILLDKIRNPEEWNVIMTPADRAEVLLAIKQVASLLSSMRAQGGSSYWNAGYHLNIRLYERLLFGVFDILDEGQLIEEHADYLKLIKLAWGTLGITQKIHDALYGWVLFLQFIETKEMLLLEQANLQVQKILSTQYEEGNEEQYTDILMCRVVNDVTEARLSLVPAIFLSIKLWCDSRLQDYHLHFSEKPVFFRRLVSMSLAVGTDNSGTDNEVKVTNSDAAEEAVVRRVRFYIEKSIEAACRRVEDTMHLISKLEGKHPLALLASELRVIAERELSVFSPVLCQWCPDAGMLASVHLHQYYGERLKPFLDDASLSENALSVLSAAHHLEHYLIQACNSNDDKNGVGSFSFNEFDFYQIHNISRPIILDWLISQHERILEWTGRAFHLEVWEPLSNQQKQAASIVEVFRIVEETVDQLFKLSLPMDISHLQALLSIIFHALDGYLLKVVSQLVEKNHLYPAPPPLTRYKETMFPIVKKKVVESLLLDEEVDDKLKGLTGVKLCVRLNTLQYMQKQINMLEDGIKNSWASNMASGYSGDYLMHSDSESVDELFVATFDSIRDSIADAIRKICDLVGTRVIFWDLRESFLFRLYHGTVEGARLENFISQIDSVLNRVCNLIDDTLRDMVVASICRAALEGYVWVLLDGGPSCAFSDSDITIMEDDLNMLKDLFVADGEGLPRSLVEVEAKLAHQILSLFSLDAESVIHMLMMASENLSTGFGSGVRGQRSLDDANTLIRILCHKKDKEASKFLKVHYHLPASSDYLDPPSYESTPKSPIGAEFLRSASVRWGDKGNSSFRLLKKRFQEVQGGSFRWS